jgi:hypothetical protein
MTGSFGIERGPDGQYQYKLLGTYKKTLLELKFLFSLPKGGGGSWWGSIFQLSCFLVCLAALDNRQRATQTSCLKQLKKRTCSLRKLLAFPSSFDNFFLRSSPSSTASASHPSYTLHLQTRTFFNIYILRFVNHEVHRVWEREGNDERLDEDRIYKTYDFQSITCHKI